MLSHWRVSDGAVLEVRGRLRRHSTVMASSLPRYTWSEARLPRTGNRSGSGGSDKTQGSGPFRFGRRVPEYRSGGKSRVLREARTRNIKELPCGFHSNLVNGLAFSLAKLGGLRLASLFLALRKCSGLPLQSGVPLKSGCWGGFWRRKTDHQVYRKDSRSLY